METQNEAILKYLRTGKTLTALEALGKFGSLRLAARINDLKQQDWKIHSRTIEVQSGKHVAEYWMDPVHQYKFFGR